MEIYSVKVDSNNYQWIMPEIGEDEILNYLTFDCTSKMSNWNEVKWYSFNPKNIDGNFYSIGSNGAFVFDEEVYDSDLFALIEMAGEIIPLYIDGRRLFLLNILECVNSLNEGLTKWDMYDDGSKGRILEYSFYSDRLSESTLFKIPQTCKSEILTYAGVKDEEDEFMKLYQKLGFSGLLFDRVF